jgi:hypothetical protein
MELKIDLEFKSLIPDLTPEEYEGLRKNLISEGCRDVIVAWDGIILDGHNRFEICTDEDIPFNTINKSFEDREDAKAWIIRNQLDRRNLSNYQRTKLALLLKPKIEAEAKEKETTHTKEGYQISDNPPIDTKKEIARLANVSHDTVNKVETIEKKASPEQKEQLQKKKKSINRVYGEIKEKAQAINKKAKEAVETAPDGKFTAKHVARTVQEVEEIKDLINRTEKRLKLQPPSNGIQFARMAIMDLEKITDDDLERDEAFALVKKWIKDNDRLLSRPEGNK